MSEYEIRALDASTWDAYAGLLDKHKGCGFGGCWCTWFHSREGRPEGLKGRPWKERLDRQERRNIRPQVRYNNTHSLYEQTGFSYDRPKGKKNCVMRVTVTPVKASRRPRVG